MALNLRCEQIFHTSAALQKDLRLTVIDAYSRTARPAVHAIATGSCPMSPPTMAAGLKPVATASGFAITRRGRSGDVAVTGRPDYTMIARNSEKADYSCILSFCDDIDISTHFP